ncbi:hypothetical protein V8C86DRAFT_2632344 [Haematococcus lacustris]
MGQALGTVLGRQDQPLGGTQLVTTCLLEGQASISELHLDFTCFVAAARCMAGREIAALECMILFRQQGQRGSGASAPCSTPHAPSSPRLPPLLSIVLGVVARCLAVLNAGIAALRLAHAVARVGHPDLSNLREALEGLCFSLYDMYDSLFDTFTALMDLFPDWLLHRAMFRAVVRTACAGAHLYNAMVTLLGQTGQVVLLESTLELEDQMHEGHRLVVQFWERVVCGFEEQETQAGHPQEEGCEAPSSQPSSTQLLAPLALDLVWAMESTLQMTCHHQRMYWQTRARDLDAHLRHLGVGLPMSIALCGHLQEVLAEACVVGPAGLAASPASWLPCGNNLVEGWCNTLLAEVCQICCTSDVGPTGIPPYHKIGACHLLLGSHQYLRQGRRCAHLGMSAAAERSLACLALMLSVAVPLVLWLNAVNRAPAIVARLADSGICAMLAEVEPERVWAWQALAAGTVAEPVLADVLQAASIKLHLPHLNVPAPQG